MPALPLIAELVADARIAALVAVPQPMLLLGADGRLLFANPAGLRLTGAATLPEAAQRNTAELGPVAETAMQLAPQLPEAGAPRLQRLKLLSANFMQPLTFAFSRFPLQDGSEAILAAGLDAAHETTPLAQAVATLLDSERDAYALYDLDGSLIEASVPGAIAIGSAATLQELNPAAEIALSGISEKNADELSFGALRILLCRIGTKAHPAVLAFFASAETPEEEVPEAAAKPAPGETEAPREPRAAPPRFVWRTDKDGVLSSVSPELASVVGTENAAIVGLDWPAAAANIGIRNAEQVAAAIARRDTWSGVSVLWPVAGSDQARPVDLAALPEFDRERRFQGYRGFGVFREPVAAAPASTAPPAQEAPVFEERPENVIPLRMPPPPEVQHELSPAERETFREIARTINQRIEEMNRSADKSGTMPAEALPLGERALLDRVPAGIVVHRNERVLYANRTVLDWIGLASVEALEAEGGLHRLFAGMPSIGASIPGEESHVLALLGENAVPIPVEAKLVSVPWKGETALAYILSRAHGAAPGETEALKLRDAEALGEELRGILDTATDGILLLDRDGKILSVNRSAEALFGYDAEEIEGEPFTRLFAPESHRGAMDYLEGLATSNFASLLNDGREMIGRVREGGLIPVFMTLGRVGEGMQKFCAVFRDITQWKRAQDELLEAKRKAEQSNTAKSEFLARISHEIRTPLNAIIGFADVMREERFGPIGNDRYREYLKDIQTSGAHLVSLINDLLDLSKIEAGKVDLSFAGVDLNDIARQCMAIMQTQANRERIIIRTSLYPDLPQVVADVRSVRQIVLNLLSNSIKFTPPGGQVIVSTQLSDRGEVLLRVRDTGIGMSETQVATAMEPFRQLSTSATTGGSGLGLPLTKALTEANRATFSVKSNVNAGTLIEITFPASRVVAD